MSYSWFTPENVLSVLAFILTVWSYALLCRLVAREEEDSSTVTWVVAVILIMIQFVGQLRLDGIFALVVSGQPTLRSCGDSRGYYTQVHAYPTLGATGLKRYVGPVETSDWYMLLVALGVTAAYLLTSSPELAIALALVADAVGMIPTIRIAFAPLDGFPLSPWWLDAVAGLLGVGAVVVGDGVQIGLIALPLYLVIINLVVVGSYHAGRWCRRALPHVIGTIVE